MFDDFTEYCKNIEQPSPLEKIFSRHISLSQKPKPTDQAGSHSLRDLNSTRVKVEKNTVDNPATSEAKVPRSVAKTGENKTAPPSKLSSNISTEVTSQ